MRREREISIGSRQRIAFTLAFRDDPNGSKAASKADSLSWGSFQIWIDGINLCSHVEDGEAIESVHWYMLPLLEWFATNWDYLFHEERLPNENAGLDACGSLFHSRFPPEGLAEEQAEQWEIRAYNWWSRHCVVSSRDGGLFPNVYMRRYQDSIEVSWGPSRLPGMPAHYRFDTHRSVRRVSPDEIASVLFEVLDDATLFLLEVDSELDRVIKLRESVEQIRNGDFRRRLALLAGLGFDPMEAQSRWDELERQLTEGIDEEIVNATFKPTSERLVIRGTCQAALMFGSLSPNISTTDAILLAEKLVNFYSPDGDPQRLRQLVHTTPVEQSEERAWRQGYDLANEFLENIDWNSLEAEWIDIDALYSWLGVQIDNVALADQSIRAVAIAGPNHRPAVLLNRSYQASHREPQRFTLAHELCHLLYDRSYGAILALASGPWAPLDVEKRANAFAAMLLMPTILVRNAVQQLNTPLNSPAAVIEVATRLRMSFSATLEHLTNLGFISTPIRDQIREQADPPT